MVRYLFYFNIYLLFIGLLISSYLFYVYTSGVDLPCTTSHGCDVVRYSPYANIFGIPVPFFGVLFYIVTILSSILVLKLHRMRFLLLVWVLCAWGFLFAGYLTYLEAFVISAWCSWCVANAIVNVLTFLIISYVLSITIKKRTLPGILK